MSNASAHSLYYKKENYQKKDLKKKICKAVTYTSILNFVFPTNFFLIILNLMSHTK